jgi:Rrf2 family nitric oxide-sensitive transcriptional repressor
MRLTIHADYGLRLLMYLGVRREGLSTVQQVADAYGVSAHHMVKVAQHLTQRGFVHAVRGRAGGLELAREPQSIRIGDVVRRMESDLTLVECFDRDKDRCTITAVCKLRPVLLEALEAFLAVLDEVTLADLLADPAPVAELLEIQPARTG